MSTDRPDEAARVAQVVERLMRMRAELGKRAFNAAVDRTMQAIGTAALTEAERRVGAGRPKRRPAGNVVPFRKPSRRPEKDA